ncbi:DUF2971 domain-containing protein [Bdellovibrio sp. HCB-162]|uniref:DUF2971 domain-containing protein n=1 Tax=Bdellovibrio sp. HCB-162 TaxID=3394234 RepID=UPI0039BC9D8F
MEELGLKIFKYSPAETIYTILYYGTILFSSPAKFNDPFDISIQSVAPYDFIEKRTDSFDPLIEMILSNKLPDGNGSEVYKKIALMHSKLKHANTKQREAARNMPRLDVWDIEAVTNSYNALLKDLKEKIESSGIFCASQTAHNHLLWAHYADDHRGAVIEFSPNLEKDSMFRRMRKVTYSNERPHLYNSYKDFVTKSLTWTSNQILADYFDRITLTKSLEWEYEEEVRLVIPKPGGVTEDEKLGYHNEELKALYIGCRMDNVIVAPLIAMARARNPSVEIYKMVPDIYEYKLNPILI